MYRNIVHGLINLKKIIRKICKECGSENLLFDAQATWSVKTQKFVLHLQETVWCNECKDTTNVVDKEIIYRKHLKIVK